MCVCARVCVSCLLIGRANPFKSWWLAVDYVGHKLPHTSAFIWSVSCDLHMYAVEPVFHCAERAQHYSITRYLADREHNACTRVLSFCSIDHRKAVVMKICVPTTRGIITHHQWMGLFTATHTRARTHTQSTYARKTDCHELSRNRAGITATAYWWINSSLLPLLLLSFCLLCAMSGRPGGRAMTSAVRACLRDGACVVLNNVENLAQ